MAPAATKTSKAAKVLEEVPKLQPQAPPPLELQPQAPPLELQPQAPPPLEPLTEATAGSCSSTACLDVHDAVTPELHLELSEPQVAKRSLEDHDDEPARKTQRTEAPEPKVAESCNTTRPLATLPPRKPIEFRCKFSQIVAFKSFFENLGSVLHEVTLQVHQNPDGFSGIVADSMDPRGVVLVHGRLTGQVELNVPKEQATFCITVKDVLDLFPNIHPNHFVDIYRLEGTTDITLYIYEPSVHATTPKVQIRTLARPIDSLSLEDMKFSYYVEIELTTFRNALKTAKSCKAMHIQLCVYEIPRARQGEKTIFFIVKFSGERMSPAFPYESRIVTTTADNGPITIRALDGNDVSEDEDRMSVLERLEDMQPSYQGTFLAEYLCLFVKSMDRFNITLRLGSGVPLIVDYPLGCSATDNLRYVLAPTLEG